MINVKEKVLCAWIALFAENFEQEHEIEMKDVLFTELELINKANNIFKGIGKTIEHIHVKNVTYVPTATSEGRYMIHSEIAALADLFRLTYPGEINMFEPTVLIDILYNESSWGKKRVISKRKCTNLLKDYFSFTKRCKEEKQFVWQKLTSREAVCLATLSLAYNMYYRTGATNEDAYFYSQAMINNVGEAYSGKKIANYMTNTICVKNSVKEHDPFLVAKGMNRRIVYKGEKNCKIVDLDKDLSVLTVNGKKTVGELLEFYNNIYSKKLDFVPADRNAREEYMPINQEKICEKKKTEESNIVKYVFVYGTLMKNQGNHRCLNDSIYIGDGVIDGYEMYDLGSYPGIVEGKGTVIGEVYQITGETENRLDCLEGEGDLYLKKPVIVRLDNNQTVFAIVYVYNRSVLGRQKLEGKYDSDPYVWYVSYGSNLLSERMKYYIHGGECYLNNSNYRGCVNKENPTDSKAVRIPYDMYYANSSGSWNGSAVSFLDVSRPGISYGRAYKIKRSQLNDIHRQEGDNSNWYPDCIRLDDIDGVPAYTFSNKDVRQKRAFRDVSFEYGLTLYLGLKETYPKMSEKEILDYLRNCGN